MDWIGTAAIWVVGSIVGIVVLVFAIKWFAQPDENGSGGGGGMFGGLDEAFNPAQHNANLEMERRRHLPVEAVVPGDRAWESDAMRIGYGVDGTPETIVLKGTRSNKPVENSSINEPDNAPADADADAPADDGPADGENPTAEPAETDTDD